MGPPPHDSAIINVVDVTAFIVMKAMALADRSNEKDPWDIFICLDAALTDEARVRLEVGRRVKGEG